MILFRVIVTSMVCVVVACGVFAVATSLLGAPITVSGCLMAAAALAFVSRIVAARRGLSESVETASPERVRRRLRALILSEASQVKRRAFDEQPV